MHPTERIAVLALHHEPAVIEQRHDHHRAGVHDVFALRVACPSGSRTMSRRTEKQIAAKTVSPRCSVSIR